VAARTVAVRGTLRSSPISPNPSLGTERGDQATVSDHIGRARLDHVEAVGRITLAKYRPAGRHVDWFQTAGQLFDGR